MLFSAITCWAGMCCMLLSLSQTTTHSPRNAFSCSIRFSANSRPCLSFSESSCTSLFDMFPYLIKNSVRCGSLTGTITPTDDIEILTHGAKIHKIWRKEIFWVKKLWKNHMKSRISTIVPKIMRNKKVLHQKWMFILYVSIMFVLAH